MSTAGKLQIEAGDRVVVLDRPDDVDLDLESTDAVDDVPAADTVLVFVGTRADLASPEVEAVVTAGRRDARAWVAYPKAGKLGTDLNRDSLAAALTERGVRPVRQVSIDDI